MTLIVSSVQLPCNDVTPLSLFQAAFRLTSIFQNIDFQLISFLNFTINDLPQTETGDWGERNFGIIQMYHQLKSSNLTHMTLMHPMRNFPY